ncbi:hypothetical protein WT24_09700 [Burkholderia sp. MSMB1078WGS]|uniref:hypothetical protein n=1 Tax=Burkholderia sp. MSMB1078WGS TaxID=1637900 RepID=UPI000758A6BD|nr:hypothetical protein [Burkholderia sp. MSMB1078WGS]KVT14255.1 hypothetical protein WT24_09700 [Burkholderia sp. MSMB1078WGS]
MNSADIMHVFELLIALAAIGLLVSGLMQSRIAAKLQSRYPGESAFLGKDSKFNYASIIWLVSGDYRSLNDPQIDSWVRVARVALLVGALALLLFFALLVYGRYRAHLM